MSLALRLAPLLVLSACSRGPATTSEPAPSAATSARAPAPPSASASAAARPPAPKEPLVLLGGGDVSYGRLQGQMLLDDPAHDFYARVSGWFRAADVRFVNLEGPLADRGRETQRPGQPLVFVGPPSGAQSLARLGVDVVSTANNHAWDYGEAALTETLSHLAKARVRAVGTGATAEEAFAPVVVERRGWRVAFLAVTDIWNDGVLARGPAKDHVADASLDRVPEIVRGLRAGPTPPDLIVLSYHGGVEYTPAPLPATLARLRAAADAGVDVVFGHHVHVIQGVELRGRAVVFYGLGNLLMRMHSGHPETEFGMLGRVRHGPGGRASVEVCPYRVLHVYPTPLSEGAATGRHEERFRALFARAQASLGGARLGASSADGCIAVEAP